MEQVLPEIFAIVLVILAIVVGVVGIQLLLVLTEVRKTLMRINNTIDIAENQLKSLQVPIDNISTTFSGLKAGYKVFESFIGFLNRKSNAE